MAAEPSGWGAYVGTVMRIEAPGGMVWVRPAPVTHTVGAYPDTEGRAIYLITAHNPGGRMASDTANASAEARLAAELDRRGLTWWPATGGDPSWTHVEPGVAVIGMDEAAAVALGAEFGQDAIFMLTPADRRVIGCADGRVLATGWSIEPDADLSPSADEHEVPEEPPTAPADADEEVAEVMVNTENLQVGEGVDSCDSGKELGPYPDEWLGSEDYLTLLGRRKGDLMSLSVGGKKVVLHGDGTGLISIRGLAEELSGPYQVADAMSILKDHGAFDCNDDHFDNEYGSGSWDPGEVAAVIAPCLDSYGDFIVDHIKYSYGDFIIDDIEWCTNGHGQADPNIPYQADAIMLASESWGLGPGGGGSPGNADSGEVVLLRIGPRYMIYQCQDGDVVADTVIAESDEDAISQFHEGFTQLP
jgi:hypothetical protein